MSQKNLHVTTAELPARVKFIADVIDSLTLLDDLANAVRLGREHGMNEEACIRQMTPEDFERNFFPMVAKNWLPEIQALRRDLKSTYKSDCSNKAQALLLIVEDAFTKIIHDVDPPPGNDAPQSDIDVIVAEVRRRRHASGDTTYYRQICVDIANRCYNDLLLAAAELRVSDGPADSPLSDRQENVLVAMLEQGMVIADTRRNIRAIVWSVDKGIDPSQLKDTMAKLRKLGLVDAMTGRSGGYWLT